MISAYDPPHIYKISGGASCDVLQPNVKLWKAVCPVLVGEILGCRHQLECTLHGSNRKAYLLTTISRVIDKDDPLDVEDISIGPKANACFE